MGKRQQSFEKRPRDYYATVDPDAVKPLIPFIRGLRVAEVCAGNGDLGELLQAHCNVIWQSDIEPQNSYVSKQDALGIHKGDLNHFDIDVIVTNPPFSWPLLQPLLDHLPELRHTWLLLPADCMHNKRMGGYMEMCSHIVSIGRLYWMDNKIKGVDNYCWFRFVNYSIRPDFYGRT